MSVKDLPSVAVANYGYCCDPVVYSPIVNLAVRFTPLVVDQSYAKTSCHLQDAVLL
jgi:hypothetical protein